jgi:hypothetical protein
MIGSNIQVKLQITETYPKRIIQVTKSADFSSRSNKSLKSRNETVQEIQ